MLSSGTRDFNDLSYETICSRSRFQLKSRRDETSTEKIEFEDMNEVVTEVTHWDEKIIYFSHQILAMAAVKCQKSLSSSFEYKFA